MRKTIHTVTRQMAMLLILAILVLSLAACSGSRADAEEAVALFAGNLQKQEYAKARAQMKDPQLVPLLTVSGATHPGTAALRDMVCSKLAFRITDVEAGDQQALVTMDLTVPDVSPLLMEYLRDALMMSLVDTPPEGLQNALQQLLVDQTDAFVKSGNATERTATVQLRLIYEQDKWTITEADQLQAALIGGFGQMVAP